MFRRSLPSRRFLGSSLVVGSTTAVTYLYLRHRSQDPLLADEPGVEPKDLSPPVLWTPPTRDQMLNALKSNVPIKGYRETEEQKTPDAAAKRGEQGEGFDLLIIGGGATGAGTAVDAASRGLKVALVERDDFSSGQSARAGPFPYPGLKRTQLCKVHRQSLPSLSMEACATSRRLSWSSTMSSECSKTPKLPSVLLTVDRFKVEARS
jgi:glycerol-3-phosphate dehydrogenase